MKNNEKIISKFKFVNLLLIVLSFSNIICYYGEISRGELEDYFKAMTIDRIRQIYWNIVCDIDKNYDIILYGNSLAKKYVEQNLHSFTRETIIENLYFSLSLTGIDYYLDIDFFIEKQKDEEYDLFSETNFRRLISVDMPKNFLANFAINIDKYERKQNRNIDGVNDYINYLTKEKLVEYLLKKLNEHSELNYYVKFKEIVLNNVDLYYEDIDEYLKTLSKDDLIDIIYGYENYFFNILDYSEITEYNYYQHEGIEENQEKELILFINSFTKEAGITTLDDFILKIENRYINYTNNKDLWDLNDTELESHLLALEKYHKRQMNITKSLRGLNDYIKNMKKDYKIRTLTWGLNLYPELYEIGRFEDILSNEINLQYGQVKEFVQVTERSLLLRYAYNIHTYQNNIDSLNDDDLHNLYRFNNEKLYELILSDTNSNKNLQVKADFLNIGDFYKDNFYKYLETLERNQLKKFVLIFIEIYFGEDYLDDYKRVSEKLTRTELTLESDTQSMLEYSQYFIKEKEKLYEKTSFFFATHKNYLKTYVYEHFGYFNNIMDFLRSTNIFYLKLWLRKYENIIRKKKLYTNIAGGMQNDILNEYTKKEVLEQFDIYLEEYPALFTPRKFIEIAGLDNGITPHKKLVELFEENIYQNNTDRIMKIIYSLTGHYQRKYIQTSFNVENFINEIRNNLNSSDLNVDFNNKYLFQLFRIINIFPELSNNQLFKYLCEDNNTRVINLYENDYLIHYSKRHISQLAKNIQYYLNNTGGYDQKIIDNMNGEELKKYILDFTENPQFKDNIELQSRILDGDFHQIIYDYFEYYLNGTDEDNLNFIYSNIKEKCAENYPCNNNSNLSTSSDKLKEIVNDIKNVQEFQNPNFFDKFFDYIPEQQKDLLYEFLFNSTIRDLKYYAIIANLFKIDICEKDPSIDANNLPKDIFLKIHYMSKNEMIKYILKIRTLDVYHISIEMLPLLVKYYMLDIGSDNIYDLSLF